MSLGDLYQQDVDRSLATMAAAPPEPPKRDDRSAWGAPWRAVKAAAADVLGSTADVLKGYGAASAMTLEADPVARAVLGDKAVQEGAAEGRRQIATGEALVSDVGQSFRQVSKDQRPDPATASKAEQIVFGVVRPVTKLVGAGVTLGPIGIGLASAEEGFTQSEDLREQGVDLATRTKIGTLTAGMNAAGAFLPMAGPTLKATAGLYLPGGPGAFMAQQQATRKILEHADYAELAKQYDPLDTTGLILSSLIPLPFVAHGALRNIRSGKTAAARPESGPPAADEAPAGAWVPPEVVDAAMTHNLTLQADAHANAEMVGRVLPTAAGELDPRAVIPGEIYDRAAAVIARSAEPADEAAAGPRLTQQQLSSAERDLAPVLGEAHTQKPAFDDMLRSIADDLGGRVKLAEVKGGDRLFEKHVLENESDVSRMRDLVRGSLIVDKIADVQKALKALSERFEVTRVKDRFTNPTPSGYRDMLVNVRLPGGLEGEVQIHVPEMLAAKKLGHKVYDIERRLPSDHPDKAGLEQLQKEIYGAAFDAAGERTSNLLYPVRSQAANSSLVSESPSANTLEGLGKSRVTPVLSENAMHLPSGSRATGTLSTSKNAASLGSSGRDMITSSPIIGENPVGRTAEVVTERGLTAPVRYRLVEASDLITSHTNDLTPTPAFPAELQPRDRARAASADQIARIENALRPELLGESVKASDGAPIIGPDAVVESGNARTIALRRAYDAGKAEAYRTWLAANAERFGLTADQVAGMRRPVLVRERFGNVDRAEFARQANESAIAAMSPTEQARSDAARITDLSGLVANEDGTINMAKSAGFVRQFMQHAVSPTERGAMLQSDGRLSQAGQQRLRNAIFAKAYGDANLVSMLAESTDSNVRNVLAGLMRAAPEVARLRDLIASGARHSMDVAPDMVRAVQEFSKLRADGMTVDQFLAQGSLLDGGLPPQLQSLLAGLQENARSPRRIGEMVRQLVNTIDAMGDPRQAGLLEDHAPSQADVTAAAVERMRTLSDEQITDTPAPLAKPANDPMLTSIADRVAAVEAAAGDMVVRTDENGRPVTVAEELARIRREAAEGTDGELGALDADLVRVAADCALSMGTA